MVHRNRSALISGLNEDLAHEYSAVIQYRTYASVVRGPDRALLRPLFAAEIADELAHAALLADKVVALGGMPIVVPALVSVATNGADMLRRALDAEASAIERYTQRRRLAEELGELGLVVDIDGIIADETRHRDEFAQLLAGWPGALPRGASRDWQDVRAPERRPAVEPAA